MSTTIAYELGRTAAGMNKSSQMPGIMQLLQMIPQLLPMLKQYFQQWSSQQGQRQPTQQQPPQGQPMPQQPPQPAQGMPGMQGPQGMQAPQPGPMPQPMMGAETPGPMPEVTAPQAAPQQSQVPQSGQDPLEGMPWTGITGRDPSTGEKYYMYRDRTGNQVRVSEAQAAESARSRGITNIPEPDTWSSDRLASWRQSAADRIPGINQKAWERGRDVSINRTMSNSPYQQGTGDAVRKSLEKQYANKFPTPGTSPGMQQNPDFNAYDLGSKLGGQG